MKRRQRRPVLDLKGQSSSQDDYYFQTKCQQSHGDAPVQTVPANPLANLLCHYNSDSDNEDSKKDGHKLDDQVNNFLKEIQFIAPKETTPPDSTALLSGNSLLQSAQYSNQNSNCKWRECIDESTGYPYYWHIETNEVTWEMPSELKALRSTNKMTNVVQPGSAPEPHWVNFSSMSYQQSNENIPEGMIPREVVARNRNRFSCNNSTQKQKQPKEEQESGNMSDANDEESDDGRIEMITSFGSEESDSESENNQSSGEPVIESSSQGGNVNSKSVVKSKDANRVDSPVSCTLGKFQPEPSTDAICHAKSEDDTSSREPPVKRKLTNKRNTETDIDFRISLVPGYEVDSDNEEESEKEQRKCLFPIPQNEDTLDSQSYPNKNLTSVQTKSIVTEDHKVNSNDSITMPMEKKVSERESEDSQQKGESAKVDQDSQKGNKFLEALQEQGKQFQRKRRIAFDVPPAKVKTTEDPETSAPKTESPNGTPPGEVEQETEPVDDAQSESQKESTKAVDESSMDSTKSLREDSSNVEDTSSQQEMPSKSKGEELTSLTQIIQEKLKFLSEGKPNISPVQTMAVQLQTLFAAWEGGFLEKNYLHRWLTETSHELERLEQDAAPPGWLCQWDRSHKRYYYQNASTGATQWTYPDTGIAGGTEEMEICSTPPPADQEDIIATAESEEPKKLFAAPVKPKKSKEDEGEKSDAGLVEHRSNDVEAPPPPKISNPSPPPPPRIFAEDLQKDKQHRDKEVSLSDTKPLEMVSSSSQAPTMPPQNPMISSVANTEPLPPGVDIPEAPYEIPAAALKRILYNTVQGASLYEAAARDPTVPILGHHIVQEHYLQYPAYHQHLHAPTALVLPHKHGVQPAIQLIPDYTPIYTNHKVIEKPPVKTRKESLVSALDSFYSDIAQIEKTRSDANNQKQEATQPEVAVATVPVEETKVEGEQVQAVPEAVAKEKKRKKARIAISKKHKEVSSMVAKWQRAQQHLEDNA